MDHIAVYRGGALEGLLLVTQLAGPRVEEQQLAAVAEHDDGAAVRTALDWLRADSGVAALGQTSLAVS